VTRGTLYRLVALLAVMGVASCQTLGGTGASGADFATYRTALSDAKGRMDRAAQNSDVPAVSKAMKEIGEQFNAIESKTSSMNLMDNETMKIQIATGRNVISQTDPWVLNNDAEAVRSQVAQLDPVLDQIDVLLDRAVKSSAAEPAPGTQ
jgi:hypothetical protein